MTMSLEDNWDTQRVQSTTAEVLTASVPAAIATIAIRGPHAIAIAQRFVHSASGKAILLRAGMVRYALWHFKTVSMQPEHIVLLVRDEQNVEIHCHGGLAITNTMLQDLFDGGCQSPHASSTTESIDALTPSAIALAARNALIHASTLKVAAVLLDQIQGALTVDLQQLQHAMRLGDQVTARALREQLLTRGQFGLKLVEPWRLTLAGPPNVGKSSLLNALCGSDRVLVHEQPGTTRDAIDTHIVIADWPIIVTDTAGIRQTDETIEQQGIATANQRWQASDIGLLIVDATSGWTPSHTMLLEHRRSRVIIVVLNKCDRLNADEVEAECRRLHEKTHELVVPTSALASDGVEELIRNIGQLLDGQQPPSGSGVPFTHAQLIQISTDR